MTNYKTIVLAKAGSHLFGTNTPASDVDYKGVFIPEADDILLGRAPKTIHKNTNTTNTKNTSDDIDKELYSLQKFMQMVAEGQTVALELLFTPEDMIIERTEEWDKILAVRDELLHGQVTAFVGYCQQQANKYGVKGSRMNTIKLTLDVLEQLPPYAKLIDCWRTLEHNLEKDEHIEFGEQYMNDKVYPYIQVAGRKFQDSVKVSYIETALEKIYASYGERARLAEKNEGIDWKALSHAVRVCYQAIELLNTGHLTLPLPEPHRLVVLDIKRGLKDYNTFVKPLIEDLVDKVKELEKVTTLRPEPNVNIMEAIVTHNYKAVINV